MYVAAVANPTVDQAVAAVRGAIDTGRPICDYGIAHRDLGYPPPKTHMPLRLASHGVLEHDAPDFTVRVSAGCTIGELQRALAAHNQFLAIDADEDLSVGEVIAHNVYGPMRVGYGAARDQLLGMAFVSGEGKPINVGGRTVKNVAGYDLTRMMVGSLGQLGIITEATFKTAAVPPRVVIADLELDDARWIGRALTPWLISDAAPAAASLVTLNGWFVLRVCFFGTDKACAAQLGVLREMVEAQGGTFVARKHECLLPEYAASQLAAGRWMRQSPALVKLIIPPATVGQAAEQLLEACPSATIEACPFHGCIFCGCPLDDAQRLDQLARSLGGLHVWYRRPSDEISPFGDSPPDYDLLVRLKRAFDPHNILNPGRFLR